MSRLAHGLRLYPPRQDVGISNPLSLAPRNAVLLVSLSSFLQVERCGLKGIRRKITLAADPKKLRWVLTNFDEEMTGFDEV
jgi:hypothetical protein